MSIYRRTVVAVAALVALSPIAPAAAQSVDLVARVPFEFTVGKTTLARDTYQLSRLTDHPDMLLVRSGRKGVMIRTEVVGPEPRAAAPSLLFHRYGDQYFLREIRLEGNRRLDLPETKAERDAAEGRADRSAAVMQTVVVSGERQ
jgi:hypothetical protein